VKKKLVEQASLSCLQKPNLIQTVVAACVVVFSLILLVHHQTLQSKIKRESLPSSVLANEEFRPLLSSEKTALDVGFSFVSTLVNRQDK